MTTSPYDLFEPDKLSSCVVFASPHSGSRYPASFLDRSVLDTRMIRSSEDAFVDTLFDCVPQFGAPLITAAMPRAYVDLNRSPDELDPSLIHGVRRSGHNPRIASGLGVIPRVVSNGRTIYSGKLTRLEADQRLERYWYPYHTALQSLLDRAHRQFDEAILVDCHSMPHEAVECVTRDRSKRPEIVLGDRFGAAASGEIVDRIEAAFATAGLTVARNTPFAGAYIAQAYGRPSRRQHAVQIEIDRALYMNEARIEKNANFEPFRQLLRSIVADIAECGAGDAALAAE